MALTEEQEIIFYNKIITSRDEVAMQIVNSKIAVDVATKFLSDIQRFTPLVPMLIDTTNPAVPEGVITKGAYYVSFLILNTGGVILGKTLNPNLEFIDFPYVGVPWGDITYNGNFLIMIGR